MVKTVPNSHPRTASSRVAAPADLATLDAMAQLASQMGSVIHVVVPREPGVLEHARSVAQRLGLDLAADLMASSIRVRFSGSGP